MRHLKLVKKDKDDNKRSHHIEHQRKLDCQLAVCPSGHVNLFFAELQLVMTAKDFRNYVSMCLDACERLENLGFPPNEDNKNPWPYD